MIVVCDSLNDRLDKAWHRLQIVVENSSPVPLSNNASVEVMVEKFDELVSELEKQYKKVR